MECPICLEEYKENECSELECKHQMHWTCIAKSGKEECPICKHSLLIPDQYKSLLTEGEHKNKERIEQDNNQASEELVQELRLDRRIRRINLTGRRIEVNLIQEWDVSDFFLQLAQLNQARERERVNVHSHTITFASQIYELKELCIETGIPFRNLLDIMNTLFED